ncbi:MAG: hypothetical protein D6732_25450 [Methanobacteriota archaeon]|nr:MAG: hypothetical protein D6732_25450 [Euryarchaeota archaeon]
MSRADITKRQLHYWKGKHLEDIGDFKGAIEEYLKYSQWLSEEDRHIPHYWIADLYRKLGKINKYVDHLLIFAYKTPPNQAASLLKERGLQLLDKSENIFALKLFEAALELNPKIGLKTIVQKLKTA